MKAFVPGVLLFTVLSAVLCGPAAAQETDARSIESCIQSKIAAEQDAKRCIGAVAQPCLDDPKSQSTASMVACLDREARAWDRLLNDTYERLSALLDGAQREALRDVQRSWIAYRDKACDRRETTREDAAGAILYAAEKATELALDAIQCLGGNGYINDYPTGRLLRDAKLYEIGAGTSEIRRWLIGRELFERTA